MDARRKLLEAKQALLSALSNGKANPADVDSGVEVIDVDPSVIALQNSARFQLASTLSGKSEPKYGFPANSLVSATDSAAVTPDQARSSLIKTMSRGRSPVETPPLEESTMHYFTPDGHQIASTVTPGSIMKLNQAKRELRGTMANLEDTTKIAMEKDELVKTMKRNGGIRNQTEDSSQTNTPNGVPFSGGFPITVQSRGRTLELLLAEQSEKVVSPSPAVSSGEDADDNGDVDDGGDWSPSQAQKEPEFSPEKVKADLVTWAMIGGGKIDRRKAKSVFLVQNGRGDSADDYEVPLATIGDDGEPQYQEKLLDDAYDHASGKYNNIANRSLQNRVIRLKKKAGHSLTSDQADYQTRHMAAASPFYSVEPNESEIDLATMKMDSTFQDAIVAIRRTQRGK
ncbi:MAG: hypothetical protein ABR985_21975 [Methanotrichaceae archaeon]